MTHRMREVKKVPLSDTDTTKGEFQGWKIPDLSKKVLYLLQKTP